MLYEPRRYALRLIHLDGAAMCADAAQVFAGAPASPSARSERPLVCLCQSSTAIIKGIKRDLNLISIFSSANG